jgi:hypothetical protein
MESQNSVRKIKFDVNRNKIHNMIVWRYAYEQARRGQWQSVAVDRQRFEKRIGEVYKVLEDILKTDHRMRIYRERFSQ